MIMTKAKTGQNSKMKINKIVLSGLCLLLLVAIPSCTDSSDNNDPAKQEKVRNIVITMIAKSAANPVFLSAKTGAEKEAENLSEKYSKISVTVKWSTPETESATEQAKLIRDAIKAKTDAIIISCSDIDSITPAINEAVDAGIQVMTFDSDAPKSKRFAYFGPDDIALGEAVLTELSRLIGGKGKIAILGGNENAPNLIQRVNGIKKAIAANKGIELVGVFYHPENEAAAIAEMMRVQELHPDLAGWAMVGGWAMFGKELMNKIEPGKIKIVAVDALPEQLEYIEKNYAQVLFGQPTFRWGKVTVETVIEKIYRNKKVDEIIRLSPIPVTIDNLGGWSRQLRAWGYQNIPDNYLRM